MFFELDTDNAETHGPSTSKRMTHLWIKFQGDAWKYSKNGVDLDKMHRECIYRWSIFNEKYNSRFLQHLVGLTRRASFSIPGIEIYELLRASVTARKMKHRSHRTKSLAAETAPVIKQETSRLKGMQKCPLILPNLLMPLVLSS